MNRNTTATTRLKTLTATAALAVAVTGLALPTAAQASAQAAPAASTTVLAAQVAEAAMASAPQVSGNLSTNPVLRTSAQGYEMRAGGKTIKRVKVRKVRGARHAARTIVTDSVTRIKLPQTRIAGNDRVDVSASVRAATGSSGHLSVSWYDAGGNFISWTGGSTLPLQGTSWRTLSASLRAPANARIAETVVNVLDSRPGTRVLITNHVVRTVKDTAPVTTPDKPTIPTPTPTPPPTPTPTPTPTPSSPVKTYAATGLDRIKMPVRSVVPGQKVRFSAEVMASAGSGAHISVSWYDATGNWMSWAGADVAPASPTAWREFIAELTVPANAAKAETVVNVLENTPGSTISIRNHQVSVVEDTPTPLPTGSMAPPSGAKLIRDLSRSHMWTSENGGWLDQLAEKGPSGEPVLRSTLVDGQVGASAARPHERNDLQGGTVPLDSVRWMTWHERFVKMPDTNLDRWNMIGPYEIHGHTLPQATVMPEVGPDKRRRLNANAGRANARYFDLGAIKLNEWSQYKFGVHYTTGNDGWIELWKDGVRVLRVDGPTTTENQSGYWKFGHYRNSDINGSSIYDVSGVRVWAP